MPRLRIIVLDQPQGNSLSYNVIFWADVPAARQSYYTNKDAVSAWSGALATDQSALQSGAMVELVQPHQLPPGTTMAQVMAYLQNQWQSYQNQVTNYNPWLHYGSTWDGTSWVVTTGQ
jgi:hypothetical protein